MLKGFRERLKKKRCFRRSTVFCVSKCGEHWGVYPYTYVHSNLSVCPVLGSRRQSAATLVRHAGEEEVAVEGEPFCGGWRKEKRVVGKETSGMA